MKLAFLGLGNMGFPMAGHLQNAGHDVTVYNRSTEKSDLWQKQFGGISKPTPKAATEGATRVMLCLGNDDDVRSVCYGDSGVFAGLQPGAILIDHTTTSAKLALELASAAGKFGAGFLDAPVSGGEVGAQNGQLTIMVGGQEKTFQQAKPILGHYARQIALLGDVGAGQLCKMVNQICIAGVLAGLSEATTLAQASGLDPIQVRDVLKHGAAQSWQMEQRMETMAAGEFDFGFAVDWMRKDLDICLDHAESLGLELPLTARVNKDYSKLQAQGLGRSDTSVLISALDT